MLTNVYLPSLKTLSGSVFSDAPFADDDAILTFAVGKNISNFAPNIFNFNVDTLYGYSGTVVETYAMTNNIKFVPIDELGIVNNIPTSKEVYQHSETSLSIVATGFKLSYQWYVTDTTIANGVIIEDANTSTIDIDTSNIGTKKYYVVVTNWDGKIKTSNLCQVNVVSDGNIKYIISATAIGNGKISESGKIFVLQGEDKILTFTPELGYKVKDVRVNDSSVGAVDSYTFKNVTANQTIVVEFEKIFLTINIECGNNGTVTPNDEIIVEYGESKTFFIIPNDGYAISFIKLNGENLEVDETIEIKNITKNQTLEVGFIQLFLITAISDENGTITPSATVVLGEKKSFEFFPNEGYKVKDVKIDNVSIGAVGQYTFVNVDAPHTISVEYEIKKFNIVLSINGQGEVNNDNHLENVAYGEDRVFTITAKEGWQLAKVYVNGEVVNVQNNTFTISNISGDISIEAIFIEEKVFVLDAKILAITFGAVILPVLLIILLLKWRKSIRRKKREVEIAQEYMERFLTNTDKKDK